MRRSLATVVVLLVTALFVVRAAVRSDAVAPGQRGLIAFASDRDAAGNGDIWTVAPDGTGLTKVVGTTDKESDPAWSPDGSKLAYVASPTSCAPSCWNLYVRDMSSGTTTKLTDYGVGVSTNDPTWSPDGTKIAFVQQHALSGGTFSTELYVIPSTGGTASQVTGTPGSSELSPDWSPNGATLVFSVGTNLLTIPSTAVSGSPAPTQLTLTGTAPAAAKYASWSPLGRIAFRGDASSFASSNDLYATNADGSGTTKLLEGGATSYIDGLTWSPDALRIAFSGSTGSSYDIKVWNSCNGNVTTLAASGASDSDPDWQPVLPAPNPLGACPTPTPTVSTPPPTSPTTTTATTTSATTTTATTTTATTTSSPPPTPPSPPPGRTVTVSDSGFDPPDVRVRLGATVIWTNVGPSIHRVVDGSAVALFDTLDLPIGWSAWRVFTAASTYRAHDVLDPSLAGVIRVPIVVTPAKGTLATVFGIRWASTTAGTGFAYDVQLKRPGARPWRLWKERVVRARVSFIADAGRGTYRFRARLVRLSDGTHTSWSPRAAIRVGS